MITKIITLRTGLSVVMRPAVHKDFGSLQNLIRQLGYQLKPESLDLYLTDKKKGIWVVERPPNQVIGCLSFSVIDQLHDAPSTMRLISLVVDHEMNGQGIATELLNEAEKTAQEKGYSVLELSSAKHRKNAHKLYEGLGYSTVTEDSNKLYFRKDLPLAKVDG